MNLSSLRHSTNLGTFALIAGWLILLLLCIGAYVPGLNGPFVLDDKGTVASLGNLGGVVNWDTFNAFVFGGHSGPTGRPLALLTFLMDARDWPAASFPFKRTNLIIHLINGVLLGVLIGQILDLLQYERRRARWIALIAAGFWLLHPFLVSTTLYIVQRMAQLSTLFIFLGLMGYLYSRSLIVVDRAKAYLLMSLSVGLFTLLAIVSKENGILLPLLVGVVEITVVASQRHRLPRLSGYWATAFIVVPSVVVAVYLGSQFFKDDFFDIVPPRDFSLYERLLTQPRVLFEYLQHWFIPKLYTTGIFQDHFIKSTGLFVPITTALSIVLHLLVIAFSIVKRREWPLLALAVLFFYTSHLLESTVLNLELYFEHRNYLAACFLLLPFVVLMSDKLPRGSHIVVVVGITAILGGFTRYSASVWESFPSMIEASARKEPMSARAQAQYATLLFDMKQHEDALTVIERAIEDIPGSNSLLRAKRIIMLCQLGALEADEFDRVAKQLSGVPYDVRSLDVYSIFSLSVVRQRCPSVRLDALLEMYVDMLQVPQNTDPQSLEYSHIKYLIGYVYAYAGRSREAVEAFDDSLSSRPGASRAMAMAAVLASANHNEEALYLSGKALSMMEENGEAGSLGAGVRTADIKEFRETVRRDLENARDVGTTDQDQ